jgi:cytochrome b561
MQRHDTTTQALHWLIALLVIATYAIGLYREALPKGDFRTALLGLHMSVGLVVLGLTVVRLAWRLAAPKLAPVPMPPMMTLASRAVHGLLYLMLVALPVVGLVAAWAKGRVVGLFGLPLPSPIALNTGLAKLLEESHEVMAHGFMLLVGLHAAAAIYHHVVMKDATLARMLPTLRTRQLA